MTPKRCEVTPIEKNGLFEDRQRSVRWSDSLFFDAVVFPRSGLGGSLRLPHPESDTRNSRSAWNRLLPTSLVALAIQSHSPDSLFSPRVRQLRSTLVSPVRSTQRLHIRKSSGGAKAVLNEIRRLPRIEPHSDPIRFKFTVVGITGLSALTILAQRVNQTASPRLSTPMETRP